MKNNHKKRVVMEEIKVKFTIQNQELIRQGLAGVYFLMQGDDVVFIGENKDISRQVSRHIKKGPQFDAIGINPVEDVKQRRLFTQALINKYQPKFNKSKGRKAAPVQKEKPRQAKKTRGKPAKEVSLPRSRMDMARSSNQNGSVYLSEPTAELVQWLAERGLGTRSDIVQQAIERYYQEQIDVEEKTHPTEFIQDDDQAEEKNNGIISDSAREALIAWTKKLNQEEYAEIPIDQSETLPETKEQAQKAVNSAYAEQTEKAKQKEDESSDLPEWLMNLADETLFGDIAIEHSNLDDGVAQNIPQQTPEASLPDWALGSTMASQAPTVASSTNQEQIPNFEMEPVPATAQNEQPPSETSANSADDEEIPDWLSDIDMTKSRGNSVSPFG